MTAQGMKAHDGETAATRGGGLRREAIETAQTAAAALAIMLVLRTFVFQPYTIPSSSMEPGLVTGDYIVVSKWSYGWSRASVHFDLPLIPHGPGGRLMGRAPQRGDVVVFRLPRSPVEEVYIKRLIGLPGDCVQVVGGQVRVNGRPLPRERIGLAEDHDAPGRVVPRMIETAPNGRRYLTFGGSADGEGDNTDVYVVPQGAYFMMGDNRDNSLDSRWPKAVGVGFVPAQNLIGKAQFEVLSWKAGASLFKPWTWLDLDPSRFFRRVR